MAALGIVGQMIQVCSTVKEAIEKCCHHFNLISNVIQLTLQPSSNSIILEFKVNSQAKELFPLATQHVVLSSLIFAYYELYYLTLKKITPIKVSIDFKHFEKGPFNQIFNTSVELNSDKNLIEFESGILEKKIVFEDFELLQILEAVACKRLQTLELKENSLSSTIVLLIHQLLNPAIPSFNIVAKNLNMSPRNLQRKLQKEGTSYLQIVEGVKKKLAVDYLKKNLSIKEISYLMGYSESGAFVSAFKKWYGNTPGRFKLLI